MAYKSAKQKAQGRHPTAKYSNSAFDHLGASFPRNPCGVRGVSQASGGARIPTGPSEFASNPGVGTGGA